MGTQSAPIRRIKIAKDEQVILETDDDCIINAESSYGYSIGDSELKVTSTPR